MRYGRKFRNRFICIRIYCVIEVALKISGEIRIMQKMMLRKNVIFFFLYIILKLNFKWIKGFNEKGEIIK